MARLRYTQQTFLEMPTVTAAFLKFFLKKTTPFPLRSWEFEGCTHQATYTHHQEVRPWGSLAIIAPSIVIISEKFHKGSLDLSIAGSKTQMYG